MCILYSSTCVLGEVHVSLWQLWPAYSGRHTEINLRWGDTEPCMLQVCALQHAVKSSHATNPRVQIGACWPPLIPGVYELMTGQITRSTWSSEPTPPWNPEVLHADVGKSVLKLWWSGIGKKTNAMQTSRAAVCDMYPGTEPTFLSKIYFKQNKMPIRSAHDSLTVTNLLCLLVAPR